MKKSIFAAVMFGLFLVDQAMADLPIIDRTDKVHERRYLDSLNVYNRRPIRINQSGFRPQDYKYAYVADPTEMTFKVIDANTGKEVSGGGNLTLIRKNVVKPNMWINGAFTPSPASTSSARKTPPARKRKTCTVPTSRPSIPRENTTSSWATTPRPPSTCTRPSTTPSSKTPCSSSVSSAVAIRIRTSTSPAT